ncbi:GroES-like protein [Martensiomyces pterosporus]|nr:GroES-like protein [Martensiomyces pterosporus]
MANQTYKAAIASKYTNQPSGFTIADLPRPGLTTATQVEVEVHAASLNPIDFKRAEGMLSIPLPEPFPLKLGYDVAGVVTKAGDSVTRFKVGDRVYGRVDSKDVGTIAEYVTCDASTLAPIPPTVSYTSAAAVPLAGLTAKQSLEKTGLKQGQSVFISGGLGGVGMFAIALAKHHFGASEIATTVSTKKIDLAKQLGATRVVDYTKEDYTSVLESWADATFDTVGDSSSYMVAKPGTKAVSVAMLADGNALDNFRNGTVPLSMIGSVKFALAKKAVAAAGWFLTRGFRAKGVEYAYVAMNSDGEDLEKSFNPLLADGRIKPVISNTYPFTEEGVQAAFKESREGHATGKIIVAVKE